MNPETLKALQESIAHWDRLASGKRKHNECVSVGDCALCERFNTPVKSIELKCAGCPVFEKTGKQFCYDTPFTHAEAISDEMDPEDPNNPMDSEEFQEAAEDELEFLKSLLPKD